MVIGEIKKIFVGQNKDKEMFIVPLQFAGGIGDQGFMGNMMGPLLKVLGAKEVEEGVFDWETTEFEGKTFVGTVTHKPNPNDPTKIFSGMSDIKSAPEGIPF